MYHCDLYCLLKWWRQRSLGQHECPEKCVKLVLSDIDGSIVFTYTKGSMAEKALNARALTGKVFMSLCDYLLEWWSTLTSIKGAVFACVSNWPMWFHNHEHTQTLRVCTGKGCSIDPHIKYVESSVCVTT